tara:strand:+ start:1993 stop:2328 length:336 start_codon:yes stop_codon:yes gene_type:complete
MEFKKTGAPLTTKTRDVNDFIDKTGNIFEAVSVLAKRSSQINEKMKEELDSKLNEFALNHEQLDEIFENAEQIAVSKYYEKLPKPWSIATKELLDDNIYMRDTSDEESDEI